jgi:hypothetical protein
MHKLDEPAFLLRVDARLPADLKVTKRKFRDGWDSVPSRDAQRLGRQVKRRDWELDVEALPLLKGGMGKTPQAATARALKLALRQVRESFNAARVEYLRVSHYPWFYLSTVAVYPQTIKRGQSSLIFPERKSLRRVAVP